MKFYSELTKNLYETEKECTESEASFKKAQEEKLAAEKKKKEDRAARAKEVEKARDEMRKAENHYHELLSAFVKDYNSFHFSISDDDLLPDFRFLFL